ncbi:hypothetical protein TrCOL_g12139 [Triparma columacea]|uniref:Uncharacterized protein n=1 Tax=Triparma columacea TaxID=722753 RepID=A0A9W7GBG9_9STRA|nr:hypothetical protein TrCOL_g12139 [Triparma columacea]
MGEFYSGWLLVFGLVISRRSAICAAENDIDDNLNMCATSLSELCMLAILRAKMSKKRKRSVNQIEEGILEEVTTKFVERVASLSDTEKAPLIDETFDEEDENEDSYFDLYDRPSGSEIAQISRNIEYLGKMFNISTNMVVGDDGHWGNECCVLKLDDDEKKKGGVELGEHMCGIAAVGMPANSFNVSEKDISSLKFVSTVLGLNDIQTSPTDLEDYDQSCCHYSLDDKRKKEFMERREENERKARDLSREPQWIHIASASFG